MIFVNLCVRRSWGKQVADRMSEYKGDDWVVRHVYYPSGEFKNVPDHWRKWYDTDDSTFDIDKELFDIDKELFEFYDVDVSGRYLTILIGWSWKVVPSSYVLCLHPSRLPRHRGGSPIQHQVLAGEFDSAMSLFWVRHDHKMDSGPIVAQQYLDLRGKVSEIYDRMASVSYGMLTSVLAQAGGRIERLPGGYPQNESEAFTNHRRKPADSEITPDMLEHMTAAELKDFVDVLQHPYPNPYIRCKDGTWLFLRDVSLKDDGA